MGENTDKNMVSVEKWMPINWNSDKNTSEKSWNAFILRHVVQVYTIFTNNCKHKIQNMSVWNKFIQFYNVAYGILKEKENRNTTKKLNFVLINLF